MSRLVLGCLALLLGGAVCAAGEVRLAGKVTNENDAPLAGAKLIVRPADTGTAGIDAYADPAGDYEIVLPTAGAYLVDVERVGHFALRDRAIHAVAGANQVDFTLIPVREVFSSVDVTSVPPPIDMDSTTTRETVTGSNLNNIPYPTTNNLRNALRIIPGVVQDGQGQLHLNGGTESQALYTLNGFNITDPLTGRFESRLSVEAVQSVDVTGGRMSAEYGKGSAGVLAINTRTGDDKYRASATNFFPGIEYRKGLIVGNWTPRVNLSGPIKRGRAWFSNSFDTQFTNTVIDELPKPFDRTRSWRFSNHLNTQVNLTPSNILYTGFLMNLFTAPRSNLGVLDPYETTTDQRTRQWFFHIKDQIYLPRRILLEVGYAANRTFGREIPQGHEIYQITPDGRRGNHFLDAARWSSRDQVLVNAFLPDFELAGEHRVKVGTDLNRLGYWQDARRTGFVNLGRNLTPTRQTEFGGSGSASIVNYETSLYVQDSWRPWRRLLLEVGLRGDWDQLLHYWNVSPRLGFAWQPPGLDQTKISGGYTMVYDATPLRVFTRPQDQYSVTTYFDQAGQPARGPAVTVFTIPHPRLARPRYGSYTLGLDQQFPWSVHTRFEYLRKRGKLGFTYLNLLEETSPSPELTALFGSPEFDAVYGLTNQRNDVYDSFRMTLRHVIRRQYEWMVSYTRSRALSNSVVDASIDEPISAERNVGPMPWDSPDRVLSWGYLPTFSKNWALAYLLEWRTGFPFSIVSDDGQVLGDVSSRRFPTYFELNLHLERRFEFRNHMWAFRMGCNNVTNHSNPTVVNNNVSSIHFLQFYGGRDRSFNFRIRWLGKSGS